MSEPSVQFDLIYEGKQILALLGYLGYLAHYTEREEKIDAQLTI